MTFATYTTQITVRLLPTSRVETPNGSVTFADWLAEEQKRFAVAGRKTRIVRFSDGDIALVEG